VKLEDYFENEVEPGVPDAPRHEWVDGVVYAMSRGTPEHGRLTSRFTVVLGKALPPDCQLYSSDTMLFIAAANHATYADVSVVCGPLETLTVRKGGMSLGQAVTKVFRRADGWAGEVATRGASVLVHAVSVDVDAVYGP
jgi:hypothetical protein